MTIYLDSILTERSWSWAIIGIGYLLGALIFRQILVWGLFAEAKELDRDLYSAAKKLYLKNSAMGWILFSISFLMVVLAWVSGKRETTPILSIAMLCLFVPSLYFLSLISHLKAFIRSLLLVLRQRMGGEKEF